MGRMKELFYEAQERTGGRVQEFYDRFGFWPSDEQIRRWEAQEAREAQTRAVNRLRR